MPKVLHNNRRPGDRSTFITVEIEDHEMALINNWGDVAVRAAVNFAARLKAKRDRMLARRGRWASRPA